MPPSHPSGAAKALYRVFVQPNLTQTPSRRIPSTPSLPHLRTPHPISRTFTTTSARLAKTRAPEQRTQKWNEEIRARHIYLVNPETSELSDLRTRYDVLNRLDKETHRLVQLAEQPDPNDGYEQKLARWEEERQAALETAREKRREEIKAYDTSPPSEREEEEWHADWSATYHDSHPRPQRKTYPICKILSKKEMYAADKARKQQQKESRKASALTSSVKTLELNWAIDANDLGHRLERMKEFLAEGRKVEVVLAAKKKGRGRRASEEECDGVLGRIREKVGEVPGAREARALEGKVGGFCTVVFQGRVAGVEK